MHELQATFVPFTAQTRMSGIDLHANGAEPKMRIRKGAAEAMRAFVESGRRNISPAGRANGG